MNVPLLLAAGLATGVVNAIAGGGSLIMFPALVAAGLPPVAANVTNSLATTGGYLASVAGSWRDLDRRLAVKLVPTAVVGSATGCWILLHTSEKAFDRVVPFLVLAASLALLVKNKRAGAQRLLVTQLTVLVITVYSGYFGAASGVMLMAGLALTMAVDLVRVSAVKNVLSTVTGLTSALIFGVFGPVDWAAVALLLPATIVGGYLGARLARRTPVGVLRAGIVSFGVLAAGWLLLR